MASKAALAMRTPLSEVVSISLTIGWAPFQVMVRAHWTTVKIRATIVDNELGSSSTPQCSISSSGKDLTHQPGGVALCAASPPGVVGETCWTVGGNATPTAWNTLPHVP